MDGGPHVCLIWFGDLIDMKQLTNGNDLNQDLYIRLAASDVGMFCFFNKARNVVFNIFVLI